MKSMLVLALTAVVFSCRSAANWTGLFDYMFYMSCRFADQPTDARKLSSLTLMYNKETLDQMSPLQRWARVNLNAPPTRVQWSKAKQNGLYTLLLVAYVIDEKCTDMYWGVSNINGNHLKEGVEISGQLTTLVKYQSPTSELSQFFIYRQTQRITSNLELRNCTSDDSKYPIPVNRRLNIDIREFTHHLKLCGPLAGLL